MLLKCIALAFSIMPLYGMQSLIAYNAPKHADYTRIKYGISKNTFLYRKSKQKNPGVELAIKYLWKNDFSICENILKQQKKLTLSEYQKFTEALSIEHDGIKEAFDKHFELEKDFEAIAMPSLGLLVSIPVFVVSFKIFAEGGVLLSIPVGMMGISFFAHGISGIFDRASILKDKNFIPRKKHELLLLNQDAIKRLTVLANELAQVQADEK